jgi:hypothetical protein
MNKVGPRVIFEPTIEERALINSLAAKAYLSPASFARMMLKIAMNELGKENS